MKSTKRILSVITLLVLAVILVGCKNTAGRPKILGADDTSVPRFSTFDPKAGVTAKDSEGNDLTAQIQISGEVDTEVPAVYELEYSVKDSEDRETKVLRRVTVTPEDTSGFRYANYLEGVNYSYLSASEKAKLFAAAENYLIENVYAGIPLYNSASRVIFSDRVSLFSEDYNGVLGFGIAFSELTEDDSHVIMYGDTYGNPGEYTWRNVFSNDPQGFNPWISDDAATSDFVDMFTGALYDFVFDETKTGYKIVPSLAKEEPIPVDAQVINGKTVASVWKIPIRDDLQWKYHPDTDTSSFSAGHEKLDANDWLWTWKTALTEKWFRARTGGGDFVSKGVKGVKDFMESPTEENWAKVGLKVIDGNTLLIEYDEPTDAFNFKYGFAGAILPALHQDIYEADPDSYGTSPTTVAASGIYFLDTYTRGQLVLYKKNDLHPDKENYHYTGYQFRFVEGSDNIFAEFEAGRLESASIPTSRVDEFLSDERVKVSPSASTTRLNINAFGTPAKRDEFKANNPSIGIDDEYLPEPILMYTEMRQALYYGLDRKHAAENVAKVYAPQHTYFAATYFLDAESGLSVRGTPEGQDTFDRFAGSSHGFVPDAAKDLFKDAVAKAIADGHYQRGTSSNYTEIEFSLIYASSGSTALQAYVQNLIEQYEALLVDDVNYVKVKFDYLDVPFPNNYYDYAMPAKADFVIGGIQGSLLDAPGFLDVFCDDNRGGFTLNWGIDTSTANIKVEYTNLNGEAVKEYWSFNAIVESLSRKVYVKEGREQKDWSNPDDLIRAYQDMDNDPATEILPGDQSLAETLLGKTFAEIMEEKDYSAVDAKVAVTQGGKNVLYVIGKVGKNWMLYNTLNLATDPKALIDAEFTKLAGAALSAEIELLDTDEKLAANEYIAAKFGWETLQEVADEFEIPLSELRVYATTYTYSGATYSDAAVLKKIGDYYLFVEWL
jgi:hypothetical protein